MLINFRFYIKNPTWVLHINVKKKFVLYKIIQYKINLLIALNYKPKSLSAHRKVSVSVFDIPGCENILSVLYTLREVYSLMQKSDLFTKRKFYGLTIYRK